MEECELAGVGRNASVGSNNDGEETWHAAEAGEESSRKVLKHPNTNSTKRWFESLVVGGVCVGWVAAVREAAMRPSLNGDKLRGRLQTQESASFQGFY